MSIESTYAAALERHETEKIAQAYAEEYGTEDNYLPPRYLAAFLELEKEAHQESIIDRFAPETGYIPAGFVDAVEKLASLEVEKEAALTAIGKGISKFVGKGVSSKGGQFGIKANRGAGVKGGGLKFTAFGKNMALTNKQLGGAALGAGALGVGGAGYMMGKE